MPRRRIGSVDRIAHQLSLRDLHVLLAVVQNGSMAKAAAKLSITQPTVSQAIADLERVFGVRLLDRSPRGVSPTIYGDVLLKRGIEAFDALQQGMRDVDRLATPGKGDVWVGSAEAWLGGFIPAIIERMAAKYPSIVVHAQHANASDFEFRQLRERKLDLMVGRILHSQLEEDLDVEVLFEEPHHVVVAASSPWATRRSVALSELMAERWILSEPSNVVTRLVAEAFRAAGLELPSPLVVTTSMVLHLPLLASGKYITTLPDSIYRYCANRWSLKRLPIELGIRSPVGIFTLKNRTLNPIVQIFLEAARSEAGGLRQPL